MNRKAIAVHSRRARGVSMKLTQRSQQGAQAQDAVADRPQAAEHTELTSRERERARKFAHLGDARNPTTEHSELRWAEEGTQHL
jgi:hypothetical protein